MNHEEFEEKVRFWLGKRIASDGDRWAAYECMMWKYNEDPARWSSQSLDALYEQVRQEYPMWTLPELKEEV